MSNQYLVEEDRECIIEMIGMVNTIIVNGSTVPADMFFAILKCTPADELAYMTTEIDGDTLIVNYKS